jgi:serine/threonine protein phosphatase 1
MKLPHRLLNPLTRLRTQLRPKAKETNPSTAPFTAIKPDNPLAVIGDVHGCVGLLERILKKIPDDRTIVCVGDIVDRGDHSRHALDLLCAQRSITVLMGNHEAMMLGFLNNPSERGRGWLQYGGLQTLASFGVGGVSVNSRSTTLTEAAKSLRDAMGDSMLDWISQWPQTLKSGNVLVTHAGADPDLPIKQQNPDNFIWGHPKFTKSQRSDGIWIAHGHTIVPEPIMDQGRIAIDTGAYATGVLTAALIDDDSVRFITA